MGKRSFGGLSGAPLEARNGLWSSGGRGGFRGGLRHAIVVFLYPDSESLPSVPIPWNGCHVHLGGRWAESFGSLRAPEVIGGSSYGLSTPVVLRTNMVVAN